MRTLWVVKTRDHDHGHPWYAATDGVDDLPARHSGQRQVGHHEIPGVPLKAFQPTRTISRDPAFVPEVFKERLDRIRTTGSSSMSRTRGALVSGTGGTSANAMPRVVWHVSARPRPRRRWSGPGNQVEKPSRLPHRRPARVEGFPTDGFLPGGTASIPLRAAPPASFREYRPRLHMRRAGIRFAGLADNTNHARGQGDSHGDLLRSYPPGRDRCQRPWAVDWTMRRERPPFPRDGGPGRPVSSADHRARRAVDGSPPLHRRGTERRFMTRIARTRSPGTGRRRLA